MSLTLTPDVSTGSETVYAITPVPPCQIFGGSYFIAILGGVLSILMVTTLRVVLPLPNAARDVSVAVMIISNAPSETLALERGTLSVIDLLPGSNDVEYSGMFLEFLRTAMERFLSSEVTSCSETVTVLFLFTRAFSLSIATIGPCWSLNKSQPAIAPPQMSDKNTMKKKVFLRLAMGSPLYNVNVVEWGNIAILPKTGI